MLSPWVEQTERGMEFGEDWGRTSSGLYVPPTVKPGEALYGSDMITIDLFAGIGGFSLGFMQAGSRVIAAVEWDANAAITYMHNLASYPVQIHFIEESDRDRLERALKKVMKGEGKKEGDPYEMMLAGHGYLSHQPEMLGVPHFFFGDIRKITGRQILDALGLEVGDVDCVIGGPPCQGFSTSGKRNVMDPRNSLVFDFARMVLEIRPKTMCMENVPGIVSMMTPEGTPVLDALCRMLEDGDFGKYETLKRSMLASAGLNPGVALRGKGHPVRGEEAGDEEEPIGVGAMRLPGFE